MGWVGSPSLLKEFGATPCGCEILNNALKTKDPRGRDVLTKDGLSARNKWNCFLADKPVSLSSAHKKTVVRVSELIGAPLPFTCPMSHVKSSEVCKVAELKSWRDKGQLGLIMPRPTQVVVDAINAMTAGVADREYHQALELERSIREKK